MLYKYKKLIQEGLVDAGVDAAVQGSSYIIKKIAEEKRKHGTEIKLSIQDIIDHAITKHKIKKNKCDEFKSDYSYFICRQEILNLKIKELENSKKYCKFNDDPTLCKLRISEEIMEKRMQVMKYNVKINNIKIYKSKLDNARNFDSGVVYDNEYAPKE